MARRYTLEREQPIPRPLADVFPFFADAANLDMMFRPLLRFFVLSPTPVEMRAGAVIDYRMCLLGVPFRWRTVIEVWEPGVRFVNVQERGPYVFWRHTHEFREVRGTTLMRDRVEYELPLGALGELAHAAVIERVLGSLFARRWRATELLFG